MQQRDLDMFKKRLTNQQWANAKKGSDQQLRRLNFLPTCEEDPTAGPMEMLTGVLPLSN